MAQKNFGSLNTRTMIPTIWKTARRANALQKTFPSGKPVFHPFPTVSNLINAAFCPLACVHDLLHGLNNVTILSRRYGGRWTEPVGNLYHDFIAWLKCSIMEGGPLPTSFRDVHFSLKEFKMYDNTTKETCWEFYLKDWYGRKQYELQQLKKDSNVYFEVFVSNDGTKFEYNGGYRSYPLYGVIDEINLDEKKIIERTIRGERSDSSDSSPPCPEDYQVWLLWKALSSVDKSKLPEPWKNIDFKKFKLVVETPFNDFEIKESDEFRRVTHDAYAWMLDIYGEKPAALVEAYRYRFCDYPNRNEHCGFFTACYGKRYKHPRARGAMRTRLGEFYRPLLWEQMWNHDLLRYCLQEMPEAELANEGLLLPGSIVAIDKNMLTIKMNTHRTNTALFRKEEGETDAKVIFGTTSVGLEVDATIGNVRRGEVKVYIKRTRFPHFKRVALVFPSTLSIVKTSPWFLKRITQRHIFWLGKIGRDNDKRAEEDSVVQLLDTLFDDRRELHMGGQENC